MKHKVQRPGPKTKLLFTVCVAFVIISSMSLNLSTTLILTPRATITPRPRRFFPTQLQLQHNLEDNLTSSQNVINKEVKILIWTTYYSNAINYTNKDKNCPVRHCTFHHDKSIAGISTSDGVLFHIWSTDFKDGDPIPEIRYPWQNYIFFSLENPRRYFISRKLNLTKFDGFFNLTATYRLDSDVPLPYGKYIPKNKPQLTSSRNFYLENKRDNSNNNATILWIVSHCKTVQQRMKFVKELQEHVKVDVFGKCGKPCARGTKCGAQPYMFYLALENDDCKDYVTEKVWINAFNENLIPIVRGTKIDYRKILPPNSFIHADDFKTVEHLALYITNVSQNETLYNSYFRWKMTYRSMDTTGLYKPYNLCKLCTVLFERRQNISFNKQYKISSWYGWKEQCAH